MTKKDLNPEAIVNELKGQSAFFQKDRSPTSKRSRRGPGDMVTQPAKKAPELQTNRLTESVSNVVTDLQSNRLTDFEDYNVPDYRKLRRVELRLTWEQNKYLDDLEGVISRDMPEGERADPNYKRITKNSVIRALVEIVRRLKLGVDAGNFKNERDLAKSIAAAIRAKLTD